jgi:hypothetical protein
VWYPISAPSLSRLRRSWAVLSRLGKHPHQFYSPLINSSRTLLPKGSSDLDRPLRLQTWLNPRGLDRRKTLPPKGSSDLDRPLRLQTWLDPRGLDHRKTLLPNGKSGLDRPPRLKVYLLPTTRSPSLTLRLLPSHCLLKRKSQIAQQIQASFESVTKVACQESHLTLMSNKNLAG